MMLERECLDDTIKIRRIDRSGMLEFCEKMPYHLQDAVQCARTIVMPTLKKQIRNIVIVGMGGSAIGGELLRDWLFDRISVPIGICRDYSLPSYVDEESLVIAVSYSGDTEETLSAFVDAVKRRCSLVTVSTGGHLQSFSKRTGVPHIKISSESPAPRAAIAYTFLPLAVVMEKFNLVEGIDRELDEAVHVLKRVSGENGLTTSFESNITKQIAFEIGDTIPVVYGYRQYKSIARRLKCQFNENSKVPSKFDVFPELNHNDIVGWEAPGNLTKQFSILLIREPREPQEIRCRIEATKEVAIKKIIEIHAQGTQRLTKMLSAMHIGDLTSIYLAFLRGVDPTPTRSIAYVKRRMGERLDTMRRLEFEITRL